MPIDMAPDYTIIVPAYNEAACLPATLRRLHEAMAAVDAHTGEIVVVDNNSTDGTAALAEAGGARIVFEAHRQIARARNAGARVAAGRWLIFVDADTLITAELLRQTLTALAGGAVCGGGTLVVFDRRVGIAARLALGAWATASVCLKWACGAYVFCLREAFEGIGGFDERYYASEELAISRALRRWGRARGKRFVILRERIVSSARKLEWFRVGALLKMLVYFAFHPSAVRDRDACWVWYRRPVDGGDGPHDSA